MADEVAVESAESGKAKAETAAPVAALAPPTIRLGDLGHALTACEAFQPEGRSTCITRELEARGYRLEAGAAEPKAAGPEAAAVSDKAEASEAL